MQDMNQRRTQMTLNKEGLWLNCDLCISSSTTTYSNKSQFIKFSYIFFFHIKKLLQNHETTAHLKPMTF